MKRLFLFIAIAAAVGVVILLVQTREGRQEKSLESGIENNEPPQITIEEPSSEMITSLIPEIIGSQFDAASANTLIANLDGQGGLELIVAAIEGTSDMLGRAAFATIHVITFTSAAGEYTSVGSINYQEWLRSVPEVKELRDLTGAGTPEILVSLQYGGASSEAEGVLQVDVANKKVNWMQLQNAQGQIQDAVFTLAVSAGHWSTVQFRNLNGDESEEILEISAQRTPFDEKILCTANVYKWNGLHFIYSEQLSQEILDRLNAECILN